jgi:hypothetical protein
MQRNSLLIQALKSQFLTKHLDTAGLYYSHDLALTQDSCLDGRSPRHCSELIHF